MSGHTLFGHAALNPFRFTEPADKESGENHIYVLDVSTGAVKVGFTSGVQKRIAIHINAAATYGATINAAWVSVPHVIARSSEAELKSHCREAATERLGTETFKGISFAEVVAAAEQLEYYRINGPRPQLPLSDNPNQLYLLTDVAEITGMSLINLQRGCAGRRFAHYDFEFGLRMSRDQILHLAPTASDHPILTTSTP